MRRVVITGAGIVSAIGNGKEAVLHSLRTTRSGMVFMPEMEALGYRCCVYAPVADLDTGNIRRSALRRMSMAAIYATAAALEALDDAGLEADRLGDQVDPERTGIVVGTGAGGANEVPKADEARLAGVRVARLGGFGIVKTMNSTASGHLAAYLGARGRTMSLSTACATGLYNIGHAFELVRRGVLDLAVSGSAEEDLWKYVGLSADNSAGMPVDFNHRPTEACRPYDRDRQGFIISAGSGIFILEELDHARSRGARIYAEVVGYGAANDGDDMFVPTGDGLRRSIEEAMQMARRSDVNSVDYINSHGTGTVKGDGVEVDILKSLFGDRPLVSSTKAISGHSQGATASQEAVYCLLMMENGFVAPTKNLDDIADDCKGINHAIDLYEGPLRAVMTCNSGLGGVNACLIMRKP